MQIILEEVDLYVTMACNLNCTFCSVRANEYRHKPLSLKRIIDLISEARELGMTHLHLTGGEPTLRSDLEEIIRHAARLGVTPRLITNGMLANRDRLRQLQDAGLSSIMVSIDGLETTHNSMRGSSRSWRKAVECVHTAVELGFRTRISSVAFQNNIQEIPELIRFAESLGVDIFSVFLGSPLGRGSAWKEQVITPDAWRGFLNLLSSRRAELAPRMEVVAEQGFLWPDTTGYDRESIKGRGTGCSTLLDECDYLIIRSDGNLYQCVFFLHDGPPIGNVANQSLAKVLATAKELSIYGELVELGTDCSSCNWNRLCRGGCRGYAFLYSRDWHQRDPRCNNDGISSPPRYYPLCPIAKLNLRTNFIGGSSEQVLE